MFGQNERMKQTLGNGETLFIREHFYTIQGEGPYAGTPAYFVRLGGCNLACHFCDTDFDFQNSTGQNVSEFIYEMITEHMEHTCGLVVLTGGEPMRQNIVPFVKECNERGMHVQIETSGTLWVPGLEGCDNFSIVCSPKTPKLHPEIIPHISALKYIISAPTAKFPRTVDDRGLPILSTQAYGFEMVPINPYAVLGVARPKELRSPSHRFPVYLQPMDVGEDEQNQKNMQYTAKLCMDHGYILCLQMHKIVGVP